MNFGKSLIIGVGEVPNIEILAFDMGSQVGYLPIPYLGLPLRTSFKSKEVWGAMADRVWNGMKGPISLERSKGDID